MENREFYQVDLPSLPLKDSTKIFITQLSPETSIQTWPYGFKTGSITDLSLNQTFVEGYYAWRNPQMKHGPYIADANHGCQMIVIVRNTDRIFT